MLFYFYNTITDALSAINCDEPQRQGNIIVEDYALTAIKNITQNANIVMDLHSAVYMFHLTQTLIKYVANRNAYFDHVG